MSILVTAKGTDAAHTLPTQFEGTTPGKAAYDAIRSFARRVTGMEATAHAVSLALLAPIVRHG